MVEKIAAISPTVPPSTTQIDRSTSIDSEPDRAWVAERQAQITAGIEMMNEEHAAELRDEDLDDRIREEKRHHPDHHPEQAHPSEEGAEDEKLSGESDRIGTGNLDEDIPFGEHVGFV